MRVRGTILRPGRGRQMILILNVMPTRLTLVPLECA
jgi:hypothetical protein